MINLCAGLNSTGYGCAATNLFKKLWQQSNKVCLWPIGNSLSVDDPSLHEPVQKALNNRDNFDANMPSLKIWHQFDLADRYSHNINSALTFFELDKLKDREIAHINSVDVLFVASKWAKDIVDRYCDTKVVVCPMGVDRSIFYPQDIRPADDTYRFFTCGKIESRKGHDVLHKIFNKAFDAHDNVELHIKWQNPFLSQEEHNKWEKMYKNTPLGPKIFFHQSGSQEELSKLMNQCDCGIFPTKAEGFGLSILEMIACNKPVITTNYSAPTEFCDDKNSMLVTPQNMEPAFDGVWFHGDGNWATIGDKEIDQFAAYMRHAYEKQIMNNKGYLDTVSLYNWGLPTKIITTHLGVSP